jgi:hypothetical protein
MKASEARALSDRICSSGLEDTLTVIVARIRTAINKGYRSTGIDSAVPSLYKHTVIAQLKEWGYTVSEGYDPRDSTFWITVSW